MGDWGKGVMHLSAIIIAKNAEEWISDAITSVAFADEVIVIDNDSIDKTKEIVIKLKGRVFSKQTSDFAELRNFALQKAFGEWVLYVDSDEMVTNELARNMKYQISNIKNEFVAFRVHRKNFYLGNHEWPYIEKLERLFRRDALKGWKGELHESPIITGLVGELDGFLLHYTHRDLTSMVAKTIEWSKIEAELRLKAEHPKMRWWRFFRVMTSAFFDSYIRQGGWKVGTVGLIESMYQAFSIFITYARLWEMQEENKK